MRLCHIAIIVVSIVCFTGLSYAQESGSLTGKYDIGGYGTVVVPSEENFNITAGGGGYLRYYVTENVVIEGAAEYSQWDFGTTPANVDGDIEGDLDVLPLMATLLYYYPASQQLNIYAGGGFTGILIDGEATGTLSPGGTGTIEFDNAIGGHVCGGFDYMVADSIFLNLDAKYTWATSDTSETVTTGSLSFPDMDMDNLTTRGGLSYRF